MKLRCTCRRGATGIAAGKLRRAMAPVSFAMWLAVFPRPAASDQGGSAAPANSPTVSSTQFQVRFSGAPGARHVVEGSGDLKEWIPVSTNTVSSAGYLDFVDVQVGEFPHRFYRTAPLSGRVSLQGLLESFRQDRILVKPKPGILLSDLEALATLLGAQILQSYPEIGDLEVLHVPSTSSVTDLSAIYQASGLVEYAEPDFQVSALAVPNDFRYNDGSLWGLHNTGQFGGLPGADIHAQDGWDVQNSAANIIVAVIDTGVRSTHEDLANNMWNNPGEIAGNGLDDDGDGYVDDVHGINAITNSGDPNDDHGHGTHVSGTVGAMGNNSVGVVGVAWRVQIMACKFLDSSGNGFISDAIKSMDYARSKGAKVVNASWGSTSFTSSALHDAIDSLRQAGIIFAAAAGNSAANNDVTPLYPASYELDNIISVAATTRTDDLAFFSDYGPTTVDLGAPGAAIYSCWNGSDNDYRYNDGTSMAAPHVAGTCALMMAHYPNDNYQQIISRILSNVDPLPALAGKCVSGGRLNLQRALSGGAPPPVVTADFTASPTSGNVPLTVQFTDQSTGTITARDWNFGDGSAHSSTQNPSHTYTNAGNYTVTLTVSGSGGATSSKSQTITATAPTQPTVSVVATDAGASEQGPDTGTFTINRTGSTASALTVNYSLGGTAQNGTDYQPLGTSVTFAAGASSTTVMVTPIDDSQVEGDETVALTLSPNAAYTVGSPNNATITIADNDGTPPGTVITLSAIDPDASEIGPDNGVIRFHRTGDTSQAIQVNWTFSGTAVNGVDYMELPTTSTFPAGLTDADLPIRPIDDSEVEGDETVIVTLTPGTGYSIGSPSSATVTIHDNDSTPPPKPTVTVVATDADASEQGTATGTFTISRAGDTSASLTVNYTLGGTAQNGADYQQLGTSVTVPAGASSTTVTVRPIDDTQVEGDETVVLSVAADAAYTVGSPGNATVIIHDNDSPPPPTADFTANPTSGNAPLTVQFTDRSTGTVTAWDWNFGDGSPHSSAQNPSHTFFNATDFTATLTVSGGGASSSKSVTIHVTTL